MSARVRRLVAQGTALALAMLPAILVVVDGAKRWRPG